MLPTLPARLWSSLRRRYPFASVFPGPRRPLRLPPPLPLSSAVSGLRIPLGDHPPPRCPTAAAPPLPRLFSASPQTPAALFLRSSLPALPPVSPFLPRFSPRPSLRSSPHTHPAPHPRIPCTFTNLFFAAAPPGTPLSPSSRFPPPTLLFPASLFCRPSPSFFRF